MKHTIRIRKGRTGDLPRVLQLVKELAAYERAPGEVTNTLQDMKRDFSRENPAFDFLVAEEKGIITGAAVFYHAYSTWKGRYIYLDDIIVTEAKRRSGTGTLLFERLLKIAASSGARQLRWHVLEWNTPAISFYKKYKVSFDGEWITCKLEHDRIKKFRHRV